jgi:hypothetical protein
MAHLTLKNPCTRCARVEEEIVSVKDVETRMKAANAITSTFSATLNADGKSPESLNFAYLCAPCRRIVAKYLRQAFRKLDKVSSERTSGTGEEAEADVEIEA